MRTLFRNNCLFTEGNIKVNLQTEDMRSLMSSNSQWLFRIRLAVAFFIFWQFNFALFKLASSSGFDFPTELRFSNRFIFLHFRKSGVLFGSSASPSTSSSSWMVVWSGEVEVIYCTLLGLSFTLLTLATGEKL